MWDRREKQNMAKAARNLETILRAPEWTKRSIRAISERMGGYPDEELRRMLTSIVAVRCRRKDGQELWGLLEMNRDDL